MSKVPRWRCQLRCSGCSRVGRGACLGCQAPGCTKSFHALCAVQKNCYLKIISTSLSSANNGLNGFKIKKNGVLGSEVDAVKCVTSKRTGDRRTRIFYCHRHTYLADNQSESSHNCQSSSSTSTSITNTNNPDKNSKNTSECSKKLFRNASFSVDSSSDVTPSPLKKAPYKPRKKATTTDQSNPLNLPIPVPTLPTQW